MVLRKAFPALAGVALLVMGGVSMAADYRADEFLGLDLSKALLSPKRLGPPTEFAPVPSEAKGDVANVDVAKTDAVGSDTAKTGTTKSDTAESGATRNDIPRSEVATVDHAREPARAKAGRRALSPRDTAIAHARVDEPRGAARTKLAHRHGNPLDAQARDTRIQAARIQPHPHRIQTWPCTSGGICDWKQ
jgi:hypothetical protein